MVAIPKDLLTFWACYAGLRSFLIKWHINKRTFFIWLSLLRWIELEKVDIESPLNLTKCVKFYRSGGSYLNNLCSLANIGILERDKGAAYNGRYKLTDRSFDMLADFENVVKSEKRVNKFKILAN